MQELFHCFDLIQLLNGLVSCLDSVLTFEINLPLQNCVGQQSCTVIVAPQFFGGDPCPGVAKKLSLEAICS